MTTTAYTDGACSGNPGPGGWAWAVTGDGPYASGAAPATTNQRLDIPADLGPADAPVKDGRSRAGASSASAAAASAASAAEGEAPPGHRIVVAGLRPPGLGGYDATQIADSVRERLTEILEAKRAIEP